MARHALFAALAVVLAAGCDSGTTSPTQARTTSTATQPSGITKAQTTTALTQVGPPVQARGSFLAMGAGGSTAKLYVVNAASGAARLLARGVDPLERPEWSPDGTHVLVTSRRRRGDDVLSYPAGGGPPLDLTPTKNRNAFGARWSPDGKQVAFLSRRRESDNYLYVVPATGGSPLLVVRHADGLAWSPNGRLLAFAPGLDYPITELTLLAVPSSGGQVRSLGTGGTGERIEWGPAGRILYESTVALISHPTYLWTARKERSLGFVHDAQFWRDGTVVYGRGSTIGFLYPRGTQRTMDLPVPADSLAWSSDGRYLAFASSPTATVYVARGGGGGVRPLPVNLDTTRLEVFGWQPQPAGAR
jgi:Tol biopolymer transport system component